MSSITEVVFIIDRSGSMARQESDIIGGFNAMIEKQRRSDYPALVTTVLFSNRLSTLHDRVPLEQVQPMTCSDYFVGGNTALLDAMGETIRHIQNIHRYARLEDRPAKTLFIIMTDGLENSSRQFNNGQIKRMVQETRERGMLIDATYGRKTASIFIMDSDHVVLSALPPEKFGAKVQTEKAEDSRS